MPTINIFGLSIPNGAGQTLYELYKKAYTPWQWFKKLKQIADDLGITFLCTVFDKSSVDLLEELDICAHKIASFELVDLPLIEYAAKTKKPLIMSTGMASIAEIEEAVKMARGAGTKDITLLKCVSSYPAKPKEMNLRTIPHMKELFDCPVGLSDHTLGIGVQVHYIPVHLHPYYRNRFGYKEKDYPVAEKYYERTLSLPLYPKMTEREVSYVIEEVLNLLNTRGNSQYV